MLDDYIEIDDIFVNSELIETKFTCDLGKCKGACCTMESQFGAPLLESEIEVIENILPIVKKYLPKKNIKVIEKKGFYEEKMETLMTTSVDNRDCVFIYYEGDIAKCAIEKAYYNGEVDFKKPISCHLFPIRVSDFGGPILRFEEYDICKCALEKGKKTNLSVLEFCQESLGRAFGEEWLNKLKKMVGF